jgi:hypothetical protein
MFLAVELLDTDKKHNSRCPDALAVNFFHGPCSGSWLVHFWYSHTYPMESVCSILDKSASGGNADTVERTKSLFSEQESIGKDSGVKQQMQQVTESRKRKFTAAMLLKREGKVAELTTVKQDRRSLP